MTRRRKTSFAPTLDGLERREVLSAAPTSLISAARVAAQAVPVAGYIDYSIPYVIAPLGVRQNAINFTSNTFHQIINGLDTAAKNFARTGSYVHLTNALSALSYRVPYGHDNLLPVWLDTVNNAAGAPGATIGGTLTALKGNLIDYVNTGVGFGFNVLKSGVNWGSDGHLIYNGKVGHAPLHSQLFAPI